MRYLDPVALAKLKNLSLELKNVAAAGQASGRHRSHLRGFSRDFAEHRPYAPGDEVKSVDWKVYARQDRFFVREYNEESILATHLLVDASGSMRFSSSGRAPKWDFACRLGMALAYLVLSKGDSAGLSTYDTKTRDFIPARAGLSQLEVLDRALASAAPKGETDLGVALSIAGARIKRRSLVIIISDLLGDPAGVLGAIKSLKARKHSLMVLQVLDPGERDWDYDGPLVIESMEDGSELSLDASALAESYREEFARRLRTFRDSFQSSEIAYAPFFTDVPWEKSLSAFLGRLR